MFNTLYQSWMCKTPEIKAGVKYKVLQLVTVRKRRVLFTGCNSRLKLSKKNLIINHILEFGLTILYSISITTTYLKMITNRIAHMSAHSDMRVSLESMSHSASKWLFSESRSAY